MHPREVLLYYNVSGMSSGSCRQLANGAIELILPSKTGTLAGSLVLYMSLSPSISALKLSLLSTSVFSVALSPV